MVLLPEKPMMARLNDDRVGFFGVQQTDYGLPVQRLRGSPVHRPLAAGAWRSRCLRAWRAGGSGQADRLLHRSGDADPVALLHQAGCGRLAEGLRGGGLPGTRSSGGTRRHPSRIRILLEDARYSVVRYFASPIQNAYGRTSPTRAPARFSRATSAGTTT